MKMQAIKAADKRTECMRTFKNVKKEHYITEDLKKSCKSSIKQTSQLGSVSKRRNSKCFRITVNIISIYEEFGGVYGWRNQYFLQTYQKNNRNLSVS